MACAWRTVASGSERGQCADKEGTCDCKITGPFGIIQVQLLGSGKRFQSGLLALFVLLLRLPITGEGRCAEDHCHGHCHDCHQHALHNMSPPFINMDVKLMVAHLSSAKGWSLAKKNVLMSTAPFSPFGVCNRIAIHNQLLFMASLVVIFEEMKSQI
jgi:hypothetical protein